MGSRRTNLTILAGLFVLVLAIVQFVSLLDARLESGDTFAPYSTLRADPMGMMALYNAVDALPQQAALRYVRPFEELPDGQRKTLVIAGAGLGMDPVPILDSLEEFVRTGGRAVIAFHPMDDDYDLTYLKRQMRARDKARLRKAGIDEDADETESEESDTKAELADAEEPELAAPAVEEPSDESAQVTTNEEKDSPDGEADEAESSESADGAQSEDTAESADEEDEAYERYLLSSIDLESEDISERWGFDYGFEMPLDEAVANRSDAALPIEAELRLRTGLYFETDDERWTPVYSRPGGEEGKNQIATVLEREMGLGSIVLCSDTYFMSNEALRKDRAPGFLQWVISGNATILFSEVHLGYGQQDRLMTLVRRYRLHGVIAGMLLLGILFIWKNSTTLLPRGEQPLLSQIEEERSQHVGLDNLLSRFVPRSALIGMCLQEWLQHFSRSPGASVVHEAKSALPNADEAAQSEETVVNLYNGIVSKLSERKSR